jgi:hypothetical protein
LSDIVGSPWSIEVKRSKRDCVLASWLTQARIQGKREGKPWLLVVGRHQDRKPIAVLPFADFLELARKAGVLPAEGGDDGGSNDVGDNRRHDGGRGIAGQLTLREAEAGLHAGIGAGDAEAGCVASDLGLAEAGASFDGSEEVGC